MPIKIGLDQQQDRDMSLLHIRKLANNILTIDSYYYYLVASTH